MTTKKQAAAAIINVLLLLSPATAFSFSSSVGRQHLHRHHLAISLAAETTAAASDVVEISDVSSKSLWATNALLFSSWTDGIVPNAAAKSFLKYSISKKLLQDHINEKENKLENSVRFSPCNGPNVDALNKLETADNLKERGKNFVFENNLDDVATQEVDKWAQETLQYVANEGGKVTVKLLYIPTAMYALNPQSSNTPGKQRQRARADGKKRRSQVLSLLESLLAVEEFPNELSVQTITLDLDDDSLKQPEGPDMTQFPKDGKEALSKWNPTVLYVEGGNTFWLQHCIDKGNYSQLLIDACTGEAGAVYCGKSAGAIVAGADVSTATWKGWDDPSIVPNKETYDDWIGLKGLQFAENLSFFPHMSDDWKELVQDKAETGNSNTCCLEENEVCCIIGESMNAFVVSS